MLLVCATVALGARVALADDASPVIVRGNASREWSADGVHFALLEGSCEVSQGATRMTADRMLVAHRIGPSGLSELVIPGRGNVVLVQYGQQSSLTEHVLRLKTSDGVRLGVPQRTPNSPATTDPLYALFLGKPSAQPAAASDDNRITLASGESVAQSIGPPLPAPAPPANGPLIGVPPGPAMQGVPLRPREGDYRRFRIFPRSSVPFNALSIGSSDTTPPEQILILSGGVQIVVDGLPTPDALQSIGMDEIGPVSLAADRVVIWTRRINQDNFQFETIQLKEMPFEVYLEGNIVLRQGNTVIRASRAIYNDRETRALLLDADLRTFIPEIGSQVRVRAERLRQLATNRYHAQNAFTTTSTFGEPGYKLQASDIFLDRRGRQDWLGRPLPENAPGGVRNPAAPNYLTSYNNTFVFEGVPLLSVPVVSGPLEDPNIPLRRVRVGSDRIFGPSVETTWDLASLTGFEAPPGTEFDLHLDQFGDRGPGVGLGTRYTGQDGVVIGDRYKGEGLIRYQYDDDLDNLGIDRRAVPPESDDRGRFFFRHRHDMPNRLSVLAGICYLSDPNYLEQYFEPEFNEGIDNDTFLNVYQDIENVRWSIFTQHELNDYQTTTNWYPKADLLWLGEPLAGGLFTYSARSSVGYGDMDPATPRPFEVFSPLPYTAPVEGGVFMTRHEIDAPLKFGPLNITPYARGEAAHWGEGLNGQPIDRLVGTLGVRSSISFSRIFADVQSDVLGLNGLAHKWELYSDYSYTDSTESIANIAQYNEIDDDAQQHYRTRYQINTFGGAFPAQVNPRQYAIRHGSGDWISPDWHELTDDLHVLRFGTRHRLQTKAGPPTRPRVRDWIVADVGASFFPDDTQNFGEPLGVIHGDLTWNISERTSVIATSLTDVFAGGQRSYSLGFLTQRSLRGQVYVGVRHDEAGLFESTLLTASYAYRLSPKWASTVSAAWDLAEGTNRGQSLTLTRVGSDFLVHFGVNYDNSKDNFGVALMIEPKFLRGVRSRSMIDPVSTRGRSFAGGL